MQSLVAAAVQTRRLVPSCVSALRHGSFCGLSLLLSHEFFGAFYPQRVTGVGHLQHKRHNDTVLMIITISAQS